MWNILKFFKNKIPKYTIDKSIIVRNLPQNAIIIEAGASIGEDTIELAKLFPKGRIYAFEPLPHIFEILKKNIKGLPNVNLFESALSHSTGNSTIYLSSNDSSSSLMEPKEHLIAHPEITFDKEIPISTISLDDFGNREGLSKIDFMWLDIQGMEFEILEASKNLFQTVDLLYTEVSLIETYKNVPLYDEFKLWLETQGFIVIWEGLYWSDMGNVLFKRIK
jgi:2-O-methyltransferase